MAYKAGVKYVCECRIGHTDDGEEYKYFSPLGELVNGVDQYAYNKGMEDAWALLREIVEIYAETCDGPCGRYSDELDKYARNQIVSITTSNTPQAAKKMLEEWKHQPRFGDEISHQGLKSIVTRAGSDFIYAIAQGGTTPKYTGESIKRIEKTGNNYAAELRELLGKIGGESE